MQRTTFAVPCNKWLKNKLRKVTLCFVWKLASSKHNIFVYHENMALYNNFDSFTQESIKSNAKLRFFFFSSTQIQYHNQYTSTGPLLTWLKLDLACSDFVRNQRTFGPVFLAAPSSDCLNIVSSRARGEEKRAALLVARWKRNTNHFSWCLCFSPIHFLLFHFLSHCHLSLQVHATPHAKHLHSTT